MVCLTVRDRTRGLGQSRVARSFILRRMKPSRLDREMLLAARPTTPSLEAYMGKRIAAQRALLGLSMEALAARSGLPLTRLQAYEAGLRRADPADLFRLCQALEVGPACFLDGIPDPEAGSEESSEG